MVVDLSRKRRWWKQRRGPLLFLISDKICGAVHHIVKREYVKNTILGTKPFKRAIFFTQISCPDSTIDIISSVEILSTTVLDCSAKLCYTSRGGSCQQSVTTYVEHLHHKTLARNHARANLRNDDDAATQKWDANPRAFDGCLPFTMHCATASALYLPFAKCDTQSEIHSYAIRLT